MERAAVSQGAYRDNILALAYSSSSPACRPLAKSTSLTQPGRSGTAAGLRPQISLRLGIRKSFPTGVLVSFNCLARNSLNSMTVRVNGRLCWGFSTSSYLTLLIFLGVFIRWQYFFFSTYSTRVSQWVETSRKCDLGRPTGQEVMSLEESWQQLLKSAVFKKSFLLFTKPQAASIWRLRWYSIVMENKQNREETKNGICDSSVID